MCEKLFISFRPRCVKQNQYLTLLMLKPENSGIISLISFLLSPWLLACPGYQLIYYRMCKINGPMSSTTNSFNYRCHLGIEKCLFPQNRFSRTIVKLLTSSISELTSKPPISNVSAPCCGTTAAFIGNQAGTSRPPVTLISVTSLSTIKPVLSWSEHGHTTVLGWISPMLTPRYKPMISS